MLDDPDLLLEDVLKVVDGDHSDVLTSQFVPPSPVGNDVHVQKHALKAADVKALSMLRKWSKRMSLSLLESSVNLTMCTILGMRLAGSRGADTGARRPYIIRRANSAKGVLASMMSRGYTANDLMVTQYAFWLRVL